jgi:hypothetical protein
MKKSFLMLLGASVFVFASCSKTEKKETDTTTATVTENTDANVDEDAMYRERSSETASQMAKDLKFDADTAMQRKVSTTYYTRAKRRSETRKKYTTDTTGMYMEMRKIDLETDQEFKSMLKPEQYQTFETSRTTYYGGFEETATSSSGMDTSSTMSGSDAASTTNADGSTMSSDAKVRTKTEKDGDTKTKIKDGDDKTKIKTDKDGTTKVKHNK